MAIQTLKPSKTPLYIANAPFLPKGTRKIFRDEIARVTHWWDPNSDDLNYAFIWNTTPQGQNFWSTWRRFLQEERRKAGHRV